MVKYKYVMTSNNRHLFTNHQKYSIVGCGATSYNLITSRN